MTGVTSGPSRSKRTPSTPINHTPRVVYRGGRRPFRPAGSRGDPGHLGLSLLRVPGPGARRRGHADLVRAVLGDDRDRDGGGRARHHVQRPDRPPAGRALAQDGGPLFAEAGRREFVPVASAALEAWEAADEAVTSLAGL